MKRLAIALVVAGLLVATTSTVAVAKTTKIGATGTATTTGMIPGTETWAGSMQSVRGLVLLQNGVWSSDFLTGPRSTPSTSTSTTPRAEARCGAAITTP